MVIDPWGEVRDAADEREEVLTADIDLDRVEEIRRALPAFSQRRPEAYRLAGEEEQSPEMGEGEQTGGKRRGAGPGAEVEMGRGRG